MKITLAVSDKNEGIYSPWWVIVDLQQNLTNGMITGPFFSREEAQVRLNGARYQYSPDARVYCMSGCYARQYDWAYQAAQKTRENA